MGKNQNAAVPEPEVGSLQSLRMGKNQNAAHQRSRGVQTSSNGYNRQMTYAAQETSYCLQYSVSCITYLKSCLLRFCKCENVRLVGPELGVITIVSKPITMVNIQVPDEQLSAASVFQSLNAATLEPKLRSFKLSRPSPVNALKASLSHIHNHPLLRLDVSSASAFKHTMPIYHVPCRHDR